MSSDDPQPRGARPELLELQQRLYLTSDTGRSEAVAKRHARGGRTARENIEALLDAGSFVEYGALALAAQRTSRSPEELIRTSPADGIICGIGTVNRALFDATRARTMVLAYDYMVFAGTQGFMGHKKLDRMLVLAQAERLPIVLFAEGGGGRPNDTDVQTVAGLDTPSFLSFAALSGWVPRIGIAAGRCFAGNAALLGCCDVIIATENSSIGMGGPAMIEGGGLGKFEPDEVGPIEVQSKNGVVDVRVRDEAEAVQAAKKYLSYFQGEAAAFTACDQSPLRQAIPENRRRAYKIRPILECVCDEGSLFELRSAFGRSVVTALARIAGRSVGILANDTFFLGGALDSNASDKAARFIQLCDAFRLPIISFCDTPGFMVGPPVEATALVRHASRLFLNAGSISVPFFTVVLRRGYGLGAQAMSGGHFHAPFLTVAWPTGEFGAMNLEGAVRLGMRKQLEAIEDEAAREAMFQGMVKIAYERGKAINMASLLELDAVIDPAETRSVLIRGLAAVQRPMPAEERRRLIDSW